MAPKVAKRPAAAAVSSGKKPRNQISGQCKDIVAALQSAGPMDSVRKMLIASVEPALRDYMDQRHEYQQTFVEWIEQELAAQRSSLEKAVVEAKSNADAAVSDTGVREAAVGAAESSFAQLSQAAAEARSKHEDARGQVNTADTTLAAAQLAEANFAVDIDAAAAKKLDLEALVSEEGLYGKMKAEVAKKKDIDAFVKLVKKDKFDDALVQTLASVLVKELPARTDFDKLVMQQFQDAVAAKIAAAVKIMDDAAPGKQRLGEDTAAAESALAAAKASAEASSAAAKDADAAVKQGEVALKEAKRALKACGPAAKDAAGAVKGAESAVEAFCSGPMAVFQELRDRRAPVEEPQGSARSIEDTPVEPIEGDAC